MSDDGGNGVFPDDIVAAILARLPAKSVCRFKSVSKIWYSIICNPHFISFYISRFPSSWGIVDRNIRVISESNEVTLNISQPPNVSIFSMFPELYESKEPCLSSFSRVISSSNGYFLFSINLKWDPYKEREKDPNGSICWRPTKFRLILANPITREWVPLQEPGRPVDHPGAIGFISRVDSAGVMEKFLVVEYQPISGAGSAMLKTFSSETGKWDVTKYGNNMLKGHIWSPGGAFEFDGHLCWTDLSCGIITLDDPFNGLEGKENTAFRFIALPRGCMRPYGCRNLGDERSIGAGGGFIHFMEVSKEDHGLYLWRLNDYQGGEWSLVHSVSFVDIWSDQSFLAYGLEKELPKPCFIHPFEADIAFFELKKRVFSVNVQSKKVESCSASYPGLSNYLIIMPFVLPSWPTSLPRCMRAVLEKEHGNEYFKENKFNESIICYTRSIALSPSATAYANRAMAYLKDGRFGEVEDDCTQALKLDAKFFKAYGRRAIARKELGNLEGSLEDVRFALELEPNNQAMMNQFAELKSLL